MNRLPDVISALLLDMLTPSSMVVLASTSRRHFFIVHPSPHVSLSSSSWHRTKYPSYWKHHFNQLKSSLSSDHSAVGLIEQLPSHQLAAFRSQLLAWPPLWWTSLSTVARPITTTTSTARASTDISQQRDHKIDDMYYKYYLLYLTVSKRVYNLRFASRNHWYLHGFIQLVDYIAWILCLGVYPFLLIIGWFIIQLWWISPPLYSIERYELWERIFVPLSIIVWYHWLIHLLYTIYVGLATHHNARYGFRRDNRWYLPRFRSRHCPEHISWWFHIPYVHFIQMRPLPLIVFTLWHSQLPIWMILLYRYGACRPSAVVDMNDIGNQNNCNYGWGFSWPGWFPFLFNTSFWLLDRIIRRIIDPHYDGHTAYFERHSRYE
jgi:hypothetical protein